MPGLSGSKGGVLVGRASRKAVFRPERKQTLVNAETGFRRAKKMLSNGQYARSVTAQRWYAFGCEGVRVWGWEGDFHELFMSQAIRVSPKIPKEKRLMSNPPIHTIRMGLIKASIWRNQTRVGDRHNVTLSRLYKNGEVWKESTRLGRDDLLVASKVLDQAHSWIVEVNQTEDDSHARRTNS